MRFCVLFLLYPRISNIIWLWYNVFRLFICLLLPFLWYWWCLFLWDIFYTETSVSDMTNLAVIAPDGTMNYAPWALFAILMVVAILSLVTIFLYRKRMLQIRLTLFSSIILVGYYVTLAAFVWGTLKECGSFTPSWTLCLPLISIILNWLAIRAIGKDEMLVKAYERLR